MVEIAIIGSDMQEVIGTAIGTLHYRITVENAISVYKGHLVRI